MGMAGRLDLLHQSGFDRLNGDPDALHGAVRQLDANALGIGAKLTLRDLGHVRSDTAAFLSDTFSVNDTTRGGTFSGDGTNSGHGFSSVKRLGIKESDASKARGISTLFSPSGQNLKFLTKCRWMK